MFASPSMFIADVLLDELLELLVGEIDGVGQYAFQVTMSFAQAMIPRLAFFLRLCVLQFLQTLLLVLDFFKRRFDLKLQS